MGNTRSKHVPERKHQRLGNTVGLKLSKPPECHFMQSSSNAHVNEEAVWIRATPAPQQTSMYDYAYMHDTEISVIKETVIAGSDRRFFKLPISPPISIPEPLLYDCTYDMINDDLVTAGRPDRQDIEICHDIDDIDIYDADVSRTRGHQNIHNHANDESTSTTQLQRQHQKKVTNSSEHISQETSLCLEYVEMVDIFKPLIIKNLLVSEILPYLPFIEDQGDLYVAFRRSPRQGVESLLNELKISKEFGKWQKFINALQLCGYEYIVKNIQGYRFINHHYQEEYLKSLSPKLSKMIRVREILPRLYAESIISQNDREEIEREDTNFGNIAAATLLLNRIPRKLTKWYTKFIAVLRNENCHDIADDLDIPKLCEMPKEKVYKAPVSLRRPTPEHEELHNDACSTYTYDDTTLPISPVDETYSEDNTCIPLKPLTVKDTVTEKPIELVPPLCDFETLRKLTNKEHSEKVPSIPPRRPIFPYREFRQRLVSSGSEHNRYISRNKATRHDVDGRCCMDSGYKDMRTSDNNDHSEHTRTNEGQYHDTNGSNTNKHLHQDDSSDAFGDETVFVTESTLSISGESQSLPKDAEKVSTIDDETSVKDIPVTDPNNGEDYGYEPYDVDCESFISQNNTLRYNESKGKPGVYNSNCQELQKNISDLRKEGNDLDEEMKHLRMKFDLHETVNGKLKQRRELLQKINIKEKEAVALKGPTDSDVAVDANAGDEYNDNQCPDSARIFWNNRTGLLDTRVKTTLHFDTTIFTTESDLETAAPVRVYGQKLFKGYMARSYQDSAIEGDYHYK